ncbi:MAG: hypothetical protein ACRCTG_14505 [Aestuariivirga sp.]
MKTLPAVAHLDPVWAFAAKAGGFWARLPVPPSLNNAYINGSKAIRASGERVAGRKHGGRRISPEYARWREEAGWMIKADRSATARPVEGRFAVALLLSPKEDGDADNRFKAIGDLLASQGVTGNDRYNDAPLTMRCPSVQRGWCEVVAVSVSALPDLLEFLASLARGASAGPAGPSAAGVPPSAAGGFPTR